MVKHKFLFLYLYIFGTVLYGTATVYFIVNLSGNEFIPIIPGKSTSDVLIIFLGIPILICFPLIFIKKLTILNFKFMKRFQRNYEYYVTEIGQHYFKAKNLIARSLLPVFLALAISQLINTIPGLSEGIFATDPIGSIIILSLMVCPLISFLLLPIWVFKDSGIIRVRKKSEGGFPPNVSYFGRVQHQSYRGFAGISTPILYFLTMTIALRSSIGFNPTTLIIFLFPLFLVGFYLPLLLLYEKRIQKIGKSIREKLNLQPLKLEILDKNFF